MRILIVQPTRTGITETFLDKMTTGLHAETLTVWGVMPRMEDRMTLRPTASNALKFVHRVLSQRNAADQWFRVACDVAFEQVIRDYRPAVVIGQYGHAATWLIDACTRTSVPLIAHFHGLDASKHAILAEYESAYQRLFGAAAAIIAVSRTMRDSLVTLGAPIDRTHRIPYGVDCSFFSGADPSKAPPIFLAVGRMVEKKGHYLTLLAFQKLLASHPVAKLRMVGDGPLLGLCKDLATNLGFASSVDFLGPRTPDEIRLEMRNARAFVQHSITASDGDAEGTPVAVIEAAASGLPVIATRHAGIPEVVVHESTGLLVKERDVDAMASCMLRLAENAAEAGCFGAQAREDALENFTQEIWLQNLWSVVASVAGTGR